jgi:hypothetical protein
MKQPYYITSERLEDILEHQYGLHHRANRSHIWTLTDLLKQCVDTSILYRIYEAGPIADVSLYRIPYIPILGATVTTNANGDPLIQIPEKNFVDRCSMYITDTAQWILWVQSAQDPTKVWAWEIRLNAIYGTLPMNDKIRSDGWRIIPNEELRRHYREWEEINATTGMQLTQQVPDAVVPANGSFFKVHSARDGWTVTQRTPTFAPAWPMLPAIKDEWL